MDPRFETYAASVCQQVRYATKREQAQIRKELTDHMEDHAQALLDGGFPENHAYRAAVESMGDPETVGRALNKEYPLHWLLLSRGLLVVIPILAVLLVFLVAQSWTTWEAKMNVLDQAHESISRPNDEAIYPLELSHPVTDDTILTIYGIRPWQQDGSWSVYLCVTSYPKHFWKVSGDFAAGLNFFSGENQLVTGQLHHQGNDYTLCVNGLFHGDPLTAHYDQYGITFDLEIPWEEVLS